MNCACCSSDDMEPENVEGEDKLIYGSRMSDQDVLDIGGFARISGCLHKLKSSEKQVGAPLEEDLGNWGHHFHSTSVPDTILQASAGDEVTFVFTNQVDGKLVPIESVRNPKNQGMEGSDIQLNDKENLNRRTADSSFLRPLQGTTLKRIRTARNGVANGTLKSNLSFGNQLPLKRL